MSISSNPEFIGLHHDSNGTLYLLDESGKNATITTISGNQVIRKNTLTLQGISNPYAFVGGNFFFASGVSQYNSSNKYELDTVLTKYNPAANTTESVTIPNVIFMGKGTFAVNNDGNRFYLLSNNKFYVCSFSSGILYSVATSSNNTYIYKNDYSNSIYETVMGKTYIWNESSKSFSLICNEAPINPWYFFNSDTMSDRLGNIYSIGNNLSKFASTGLQDVNLNVGSTNNYFYMANGNTVYSYQMGNFAQYGKIAFSQRIRAFCCAETQIYVVSGQTLNILSDGDFVKSNNSSSSNGSSNGSSSSNGSGLVTSNVYHFNNNQNLITYVPAESTITTFKKNINLNGCTVSFKNSCNECQTCGLVKTGFTVSFSFNGAVTRNYTIIVSGDVTGSGTVNDKDLTAICDNLTGNKSLNSNQSLAADVDHDSSVTTRDLLIIAKGIESKTVIN
ncbi:MAG: dockerin type I repeat-containing protein [Bacillota bacterium]|nr:dockerin type I repeat-containing protein [Bacillota bacterium]